MSEISQWVLLILNVMIAAHELAQGRDWVLNAVAATVLAIVIDAQSRIRARIKRKRELGGKR